MSKSNSGRQSVLAWSLLLLLTSGACTGLLVARRYGSGDRSLDRWRQQLADMTEQEAADFLLGHAGESLEPAWLLAALGSNRPQVVQAARDLLIETCDRWQLEPARIRRPMRRSWPGSWRAGSRLGPGGAAGRLGAGGPLAALARR